MSENNVDDIRDRIRYLREDILKLKQNEMSIKLGLKQGSLSDIERKKTKNVTDRVINDICREFSVNEEWLKYGTGEMFIKNDSTIVDKLANEYKLTSNAKNYLKTFLNLTPEQRETLAEFAINFANAVATDEIAATKEASIEGKLEAYRKELEAELKGETLSASLTPSEKLA